MNAQWWAIDRQAKVRIFKYDSSHAYGKLRVPFFHCHTRTLALRFLLGTRMGPMFLHHFSRWCMKTHMLREPLFSPLPGLCLGSREFSLSVIQSRRTPRMALSSACGGSWTWLCFHPLWAALFLWNVSAVPCIRICAFLAKLLFGTMKAALAEMLAFVVSVLVVQESVQPSHIRVVCFFFVLYEHQVDSRDASSFSLSLCTMTVSVFFPAKDIYCQARVLLF